MEEQKPKSESLIAPGLNPTALVWMILLGLPTLLLFLIFEKQGL